MRAIKVRRSGIERIFKKTPFRNWLDEQSRSALTYDVNIERRDEKGWTVENFVRECWERKMDVRIGTVMKWQQGSNPRPGFLHELRKAFHSITF